MMNRDLSPFDKEFKSLIDSYEPSYSTGSWHRLEKDLLKPKVRIGYYLVASVVALLLILFVVLQNDLNVTESQKQIAQTPLINKTSVLKDSVIKQERGVQLGRYNADVQEYQELEPSESKVSEVIQEKIIEPIAERVSKKEKKQQDVSSNSLLCASEVIEPEEFSPEFDVQETKGCVPFTCSAMVKNVPESYKVRWLIDQVEISDKCKLKHIFESSGRFDLSVYIADDSGREVYQNHESIEVFEVPVLDFEFKEEDGLLVIDNQSTSYKTIEWAFSGIKTTETSPQFEMLYSGVYQLELTLKNAESCVAHRVEEIKYEVNHQVFAPNAFSPDADGINDEFEVKYRAREGYKYTLQIFNATGKLLFESSDRLASWSGEAPSVISGQQNVKYLWRLIIEDPRGYKVIKEGYFSQL